MAYIGLIFDYKQGAIPQSTAYEILVAELGQLGFESFDESDGQLKAYIQESDFDEKRLNDIFLLDQAEVEFDIEKQLIEQVNWNAEWEKNFQPIVVDDLIGVRAPFHGAMNLQHEIVIEPKMSFGTGHHETTHLMLKHLLALSLQGKTVLDMGCGTGILAIFASMKKAKAVDAIDIDEWCYENSIENFDRNHCDNIKAYLGGADLLNNQAYDLIIANINKNILLADMDRYRSVLKKGGTLLLSGFYKQDIEDIDDCAAQLGLKLELTLERNNWVALRYKCLSALT